MTSSGDIEVFLDEVMHAARTESRPALREKQRLGRRGLAATLEIVSQGSQDRFSEGNRPLGTALVSQDPHVPRGLSQHDISDRQVDELAESDAGLHEQLEDGTVPKAVATVNIGGAHVGREASGTPNRLKLSPDNSFRER